MLIWKLIPAFDGFREYLLPPDTQPLHETLYFSSAHALRQHLNAAPRVALHTALNNPYYYLKVRGGRRSDGSVQIPGFTCHRDSIDVLLSWAGSGQLGVAPLSDILKSSLDFRGLFPKPVN